MESPARWGNADSVVLDIGDGVGALVVYTGADLEGAEIEVSPRDQPAKRVHTAVRRRHVGGTTHFAAAFSSLAEGAYLLWRDEPPAAADPVEVAGGAVTTVYWREL